MDKGWLVTIILLTTCAGCSSPNIDENSEQRAGEHMTLAQSLEADSNYGPAVQEYVLVTELYPRTTHYQAAVRKAALLYNDPRNPLASDSLAVHWFRIYSSLPLSNEEHENVEAHLRCIERIASLKRILALRDSTADSLAIVIKDHQALLETRSRELKDLERELSLTREELQKLRQIDIELGREREK
jgi:hypothetical protein